MKTREVASVPFEPIPPPPTALADIEARARVRGQQLRRRAHGRRRVLAGGIAAGLVAAVLLALPTGEKVPLRLTGEPPPAPPSTIDLSSSGPPVATATTRPAQRGTPTTRTGASSVTPTVRRVHAGVAIERVNAQAHSEIAVQTRSGAPTRVVTPPDSNARGPALSPDGTRLAFSSNRANLMAALQTVEDIYMADVDGSNVRRLTNVALGSYYGSSFPAWSPDGRQIAYVSDAANARTHDLWIMNADGSNQRRVFAAGGIYAPAWSPDGRTIAFGRIGAGVVEAWVVNPDGSGGRSVTTAAELGVSWLADGRLVLDKSHGPRSEVVAIDVKTGRQTVLYSAGSRLWFLRPCGADQLVAIRDADGLGGDPEKPANVSAKSELILIGLDGSSPTVVDVAPAGWNNQGNACRAG